MTLSMLQQGRSSGRVVSVGLPGFSFLLECLPWRRERAEKALLQTLTTAIGSMLFQEKRRCFNHSSEGKEKLLLKFLSYSGIIVRGNPAKYKGRNPESFRV